jgi:hypothetical protein
MLRWALRVTCCAYFATLSCPSRAYPAAIDWAYHTIRAFRLRYFTHGALAGHVAGTLCLTTSARTSSTAASTPPTRPSLLLPYVAWSVTCSSASRAKCDSPLPFAAGVHGSAPGHAACRALQRSTSTGGMADRCLFCGGRSSCWKHHGTGTSIRAVQRGRGGEALDPLTDECETAMVPFNIANGTNSTPLKCSDQEVANGSSAFDRVDAAQPACSVIYFSMKTAPSFWQLMAWLHCVCVHRRLACSHNSKLSCCCPTKVSASLAKNCM